MPKQTGDVSFQNINCFKKNQKHDRDCYASCSSHSRKDGEGKKLLAHIHAIKPREGFHQSWHELFPQPICKTIPTNGYDFGYNVHVTGLQTSSSCSIHFVKKPNNSNSALPLVL